MAKSISLSAVIEGIRSKKDRSLGLSISTPELNVTEKAYFMELQGLNVYLLITPQDEKGEYYKVDKDLSQKSQSTRIRNVLFIVWNQDRQGDFEQFYKLETEKIIEQLKGRIND